MKTTTEKLKKSALKLTITVESEKVKKAYEEVLEEKVKTTAVEGFREGKAPKNMVEEKLGVSALYGDAVNLLLQTYYVQAVKENHINPLSNPKIEIKEFDLDKDFVFTAEVAIKPEVSVKPFKDALKKKYEEKSKELKKENEEKIKKGEEITMDHVHMHANDVLDVLLEKSEVEIADILIEEEANRMLTQLLQQIKSIGLSVEDYLKAQQTDVEKLQEGYKKSAENNLKAEFILSKLVQDEKIEIEEKEIDEAFEIAGVSGVDERKTDPVERFYVKTILQKNKLISNLINEVQGEHTHE
jgi:FKBP-type peptidyl-prolyl cis-trans isomerase (trigger factor)